MANIRPVADAGSNQTVIRGTQVTLSGSGSTDSDGEIVEYDWEQVSGPNITLAGSGATRTFTPTVTGTYVFGLTVTDDGTAVIVDPPPDPDPDPDPYPDPDPVPPPSWQAAVDSRDFAQVDAWYSAYTGFDGINPNDPSDTPIAIGDLTSVGTLRSTAPGQVLEGYRATSVRIEHSNVTVRRCLVEGGGTYGWSTNPTFGADHTGVVTEFCTFDGGDPPVDKATMVTQHHSGPAYIFRNCEMRGWSSGILANSGADVSYCWTHDFYGSSVSGAHVSSFNARGPYVRFFRNYGTEGGSPIMSIYFDVRACHYIDIRENILNGSGNNSPSYLIFGKQGPYEATATNIIVGDNYLGNEYQYGRQAGMGSVPWGESGNVRTPNIDFLTGNPIT